MNEYVLMTYYIKYLKEIRKVSDSTVRHYQGALKTISKYLVNKRKIETNIYEIEDIGELEVIKEFLYHDPEFMELDKRGHQMYTAGLNNYYRFANGEAFADVSKDIQIMDVEIPATTRETRIVETWKRSSIIKIQALESANYQCEMDETHRTFIAKSTGHPYMEGHHALPMQIQGRFDQSLDVYANIICLCPICHRLIHYGLDSEKEKVINKIYYDRADRLAASGIKLSHDEFKSFALGESIIA